MSSKCKTLKDAPFEWMSRVFFCGIYLIAQWLIDFPDKTKTKLCNFRCRIWIFNAVQKRQEKERTGQETRMFNYGGGVDSKDGEIKCLPDIFFQNLIQLILLAGAGKNPKLLEGMKLLPK